ncbi:ABC transporter substrate-binding protein [Protaetiibacter larvae]|uniref:Solute-binding protein family 5 domain-containing protein n=1 Tax=Protaetiibacter larvae TaxID=2592654 RepID=A0A5C1Y929_9MICO|nr:ABC transporter substrate-binding protein [Protaetiibacter larvae]QEO09452.1 hypothetical protein FLP23_05170 [Protaetiibacter larvae]
MKLSRRLALVATLAATATIVAGCAGPAADPKTGDSANQPRPGGTVVIAWTSDQNGVDAASLNNVRENITRQLTDSLVFRNPDSGEFEPWLAESWKVSDDVKEYTFTLRQDVTFNDGTKLDAEVVKANIEALQQPGVHSTPAGLVAGVKVEVVDEYTVKFTLPRGNAGFLANLSRADVGIVSAATAAKPLAERQTSIDGSGPYSLVSWTVNEGAVIKRRDDYNWAPASISHDGPAYIEEIRYQVIPEAQVIYESLKSGEVDFYESVGGLFVDDLKANGVNVSGLLSPPGTAGEAPVNVSNPILRDKRVRQALTHGIDRDAINQAIWLGKDQPASSIFNRSNPYWEDLSEYLSYDPEQSIELLEEAGWTEIGSDGIRVKDGVRLSLRLAQDSPTTQIFKEQWKKIGVEAVLDPPLPAEANQRILTGEYDVTYWEHTYPDSDILRANYGKTTGSNRSILDLDNPEDKHLDDLLQQQLSISDPEERKKVVSEAATILVRDAYTIPVLERTKVWGFTSRLHDVKANGVDQIFYNAWVDDAE